MPPQPRSLEPTPEVVHYMRLRDHFVRAGDWPAVGECDAHLRRLGIAVVQRDPDAVPVYERAVPDPPKRRGRPPKQKVDPE